MYEEGSGERITRELKRRDRVAGLRGWQLEEISWARADKEGPAEAT